MARPAVCAQILINSLDAGKAQHEKVSTNGHELDSVMSLPVFDAVLQPAILYGALNHALSAMAKPSACALQTT